MLLYLPGENLSEMCMVEIDIETTSIEELPVNVVESLMFPNVPHVIMFMCGASLMNTERMLTSVVRQIGRLGRF